MCLLNILKFFGQIINGLVLGLINIEKQILHKMLYLAKYKPYMAYIKLLTMDLHGPSYIFLLSFLDVGDWSFVSLIS